MPVPTVGGSLFRKTFLGLVCAQHKRIFWPGGLRMVKGWPEALQDFLPSSCCPISSSQCNKLSVVSGPLLDIVGGKTWSGTEILSTNRFQPRLQSG